MRGVVEVRGKGKALCPSTHPAAAQLGGWLELQRTECVSAASPQPTPACGHAGESSRQQHACREADQAPHTHPQPFVHQAATAKHQGMTRAHHTYHTRTTSHHTTPTCRRTLARRRAHLGQAVAAVHLAIVLPRQRRCLVAQLIQLERPHALQPLSVDARQVGTGVPLLPHALLAQPALAAAATWSRCAAAFCVTRSVARTAPPVLSARRTQEAALQSRFSPPCCPSPTTCPAPPCASSLT